MRMRIHNSCLVMAEKGESSGKLVELCSKDATVDDVTELLSSTKMVVDETDKNGMTALMHAAYRGNMAVCRKLLQHKADVNWNGHKDGYTALMFATIAGHREVVELLLENGARTDVVNGVSKTAAQLGSFAGQHKCVRIINNHFPLSQLDYYTTTQGLEKAPKLDPVNAVPLHRLISMQTVHPVKIMVTLQSVLPQLFAAWSSVCKVLQLLREKAEKEEREPWALKMHCLYFIIERCGRNGINATLKLVLNCREEDGVAESLDRFLRQCLQEYPNTHSQLLKQMVATLSKTPPGGPPSAVSLFQQMVFGKKSEIEESLESCNVCGDLATTAKKCSRCKEVYYCGTECQALAWTVGNHRKLCKLWSAKREERSSKKQDSQQRTKTSED